MGQRRWLLGSGRRGVKVMRRAYKYRLYPNKSQLRELDVNLETLRRLYNQALEIRKTLWAANKVSVKFKDQSRWFTEARKSNSWYERLNRNTAQSCLKRLDKAFQNFFRRVREAKPGVKVGYPRFKGRDRFDSIEYLTPNNGYKLDGDRIRLQNIGNVRIKLHRPYEGKVKQIVVKREADKWYLVVSCDLGDVCVPPSTNPPVGIDVGIEAFLTTSEGERVENPKYIKQVLPELRRLQRRIDLKEQAKPENLPKRQLMKRGSKRRNKEKAEIRKLHVRVCNLRKEHHYRVANDLVSRYGTIAVESLNIQGMVKNRRLARAISDVAWGGFLSTLRHKAESAGVTIVDVDARGTSQDCSGCGVTVPKSLGVRRHRCPECGLDLHRDENAARNILARGLILKT